MIIHTTFIGFLQGSSIDAVWLYVTVGLVILFQLIIIVASLRIMDRYTSLGNLPFYVSAHLMIFKLLAEQLYKNYQMYKDNKPLNLQSEHFSNKLIYLFLYILVICALYGGVAYASDEECTSPTVEGQSTGRYLRTGGTFAGGAVSYEGISMLREAWDNWRDSSEQGTVLNDKIQECVVAKNALYGIDYKLRDEYILIRKVDIYLQKVQEEAPNADLEDLREYKNKIENYTTKLKSRYETYEEFKSHLTHQVYRRLFGVNNCCCGPRITKES